MIAALTGSGDAGTTFIVRDLRLPRALCGLLVGIALGISGAIFQSLTRNPLGSPDIIGFEQGASVGALIVITVLAGSGAAVSAGALAGGAVTALAVYGLAFRRGGTSGYRLILVGHRDRLPDARRSSTTCSPARASRRPRRPRAGCSAPSTAAAGQDVVPLLIALAMLLPADDARPGARCARSSWATTPPTPSACASSARASRLVALAVALVSVSVVAVGPIGFVALTAPQIARRLARTAGPPLLCSALTGAVIVLAADIAAQRLIPSTTPARRRDDGGLRRPLPGLAADDRMEGGPRMTESRCRRRS